MQKGMGAVPVFITRNWVKKPSSVSWYRTRRENGKGYRASVSADEQLMAALTLLSKS